MRETFNVLLIAVFVWALACVANTACMVIATWYLFR